MASPAVQYFPHCNNRYDFGKNTLASTKVCFDFLHKFCLKHPILRRTERDMIKHVYLSSCKVRKFLSDFNECWISRNIFEKFSSIKFPENPSNESRVVPCQTDVRTDITNLIVVFRNFAKAPKKGDQHFVAKWLGLYSYNRQLREGIKVSGYLKRVT